MSRIKNTLPQKYEYFLSGIEIIEEGVKEINIKEKR